MSLGSSRGWRYRFSCLGATLLLGALALTSSARAQAPALPPSPSVQRMSPVREEVRVADLV